MEPSDHPKVFQGEPSGGHNARSMQSALPTLPPPKPLPSALKPMQSSFRKVYCMEEASPSPFPGLVAGVLEMRVKEGSKIRNLMGFAMARMQGEHRDSEGGLRQVVFAGSGRAVTKTITCAEIMKRRVGGLHQLTKLRYKCVQEVWESGEGSTPQTTVHRNVPAISILLSKDPLDPREPGYQPPGDLGVFWSAPSQAEEHESPQLATGKRPLSPLMQPSQTDSKRFYSGVRVTCTQALTY